MTEFKELDLDELENVSGGTSGRSVETIKWDFTKDAPVYVILSDGTRVPGKVTKRAYYKILDYLDFYYIESSTNASVNGWYAGRYFKGDSVELRLVTTDWNPGTKYTVPW